MEHDLVERGVRCAAWRVAVVAFFSLLTVFGGVTIEVPAGTPLQSVFDRVASVPRQGGLEVVLAPGEYPLTEAAVLKPAAGGDGRERVIYRSADPAHPAVITGGRRLAGWQVGADGAWRVTLPEVKAGRWNFSRLFADGVRRFRPRYPADGYSLTVSSVLAKVEGRCTGTFHGRTAGFVYEGDAFDPAWANREDLEIFTLQNWNTSRMRIGSLDTANRTVLFSAPRYYTGGHSAYRDRRFWVENVKEMFGRPGSWYLDRPTGALAYMPCPGETPERTVIEVPVAERLLRICGDRDRDVTNVEFRDLVFKLDGHGVPPEGSFTVQGAFQVPAAIELVRARNIAFAGCVMTCLGGYAMGFGPGVHDCCVTDTLMRDLGAGGVKIGFPYKGYADVPTDAPHPTGESVDGFDGKAWELTGGITVENCRITACGRVFPEGVGILSMQASNNRYLQNEIDDLYYTGISVGWDWAGRSTRAHHNEVAYNHIHNVGQRLLSDMGFVYLLGRAPGTTVHHNYLHDSSTFAYDSAGIYPDESSGGLEIHHNLVCDSFLSYHQNQNGGDRNDVHDNVFLYGRTGQYDYHVLADRQENVEVAFRRNVFLWRAPARAGMPGVRYTPDHTEANTTVRFAAGLVAESNVYWRTDGAVKAFNAPEPCDFETWRLRSGADAGSVYADPKIKRLPNGGVRFAADSPARALGVEVLDVAETGPVGGAPKCATFASASVPPIYEEKTTSITDGRLTVVLDETNGGLTVSDGVSGAVWKTVDGAVTNVFKSIRTVRKLAPDKLRFRNSVACVEGFDQRAADVSVCCGVLVVDIVREAGVAWPMPVGLRDLDDVRYPYAMLPMNEAARTNELRVVRNAKIEVTP